jgi:hypothetical protein
MGNMEYSAVSQPFPVFFKKGAVFSSSDAAHKTFVLPNSTITEPGTFRKYPLVMRTGRSSSNFLP